MKLTNEWVGYLDRSSDQIKAALLARLGTRAPELTDTSDSNPLIIAIDMFCGLAEMLNYYIDSAARESFINSAELYKSMVDLVSILDYRIKSNQPESVDVVFTLNNPAPVGGIIIPIGTRISTGSYEYRTTSSATIEEGETTITIGCAQLVRMELINIGTTNGSQNQVFNLGTNYAEGTATLTIDGEVYDLVDSFAKSASTDANFIIEVNPLKESTIVLGDGVTGKLPVSGKTVFATFDQTFGPLGAAGRNELTTITSILILPDTYTITCTNPQPSSGGSFVESIEQIRKNAPLFVRTLDRAVTVKDLEDVVKMYPGVQNAKVLERCSKNITLLIAPTAGPLGGIASQSLLDSITLYLDKRRMYGTKIQPTAAGVSTIVLELNVHAKYRKDLVTMQQDCINALLQAYNYNNSDINRGIYISDILSVVDNLDKVDYVTPLTVKLLPYVRPINHQIQLIYNLILNTVESTSTYIVTYFTTAYTVVKDSQYMGVFLVGNTYSDGEIEFTLVGSDEYEQGAEWTFTIYPTNTDIVVSDNSVPVLEEGNITLHTFEYGI